MATKKASCIVLFINVCVRFSVTNRQKHMKKYEFESKLISLQW